MLERVWNGMIVVKVVVYPETSHVTVMTPFFANVKRIHYPHSLLLKVARFYSALGDDTIARMMTIESACLYFEHLHASSSEGGSWKTVPWNRPIGLVFDILNIGDAIEDNVLSLRLVITNTDKALRCDEEMCRLFYFNALKEAEALRRISKHRRVMEMSRAEQASLWDAVRGDSTALSIFANINERCVLRDVGKTVALMLYDEHGKMRCGPVPFEDDLCIGEACRIVLNKQPTILLTHGIKIDVDTPLSSLTQSLTYPDNMLHIVVQ